MKTATKTLGQQLKERRTQLGLTVKELADRAGISSRAVDKFEKDQHKPSENIREAICSVLKITISEIVTPLK